MTLSEFILAWRELAPVTKGKCFYCGVQTNKEGKPSHAIFQTKDHVIPHSAKGKASLTNRVVCCRKCNSLKEDLTLHEFKRRSGIQIFHSEEVLGVRIDDLSDITEVTLFVVNARRIEGRSVKFDGKPEPRSREISPLDILPQPTTDASSNSQQDC